MKKIWMYFGIPGCIPKYIQGLGIILGLVDPSRNMVASTAYFGIFSSVFCCSIFCPFDILSVRHYVCWYFVCRHFVCIPLPYGGRPTFESIVWYKACVFGSKVIVLSYYSIICKVPSGIQIMMFFNWVIRCLWDHCIKCSSIVTPLLINCNS